MKLRLTADRNLENKKKKDTSLKVHMIQTADGVRAQSQTFPLGITGLALNLFKQSNSYGINYDLTSLYTIKLLF